MKRLSTFSTLVTAALATIVTGSAWSHEAIPGQGGNNTYAQSNSPAPGWYPPPPPANSYRYAQPWQQQAYRPIPQPGYGQLPPPYPPPVQGYHPSPAAPVTGETPLSAELERTREQLAAKSTELGKVHATLEQLRVILQHRLEAEITLNEKLATLTSDQQLMRARVEELSAELAVTTTTLEQNQQQHADARKQAQQLIAERDQLRADLSSREEQLAELQTELQTGTQALEQAQSDATASSQQLEASRAQAEALKGEQKALETQLVDRESALQEAKQSLAKMAAERDQLQSALATRDQELARAEAEAAAASDQSDTALAKAIAERDKLQADIAAQGVELDRLRVELAADQSEQALAQAIAERDNLQAELVTLSAELNLVQADSAKNQSTQTALTRAIDERDKLQAALSAREQELAEVEAIRKADAQSAMPAATEPAADEKPATATAEIAAFQTAGPDADGDNIPDSIDLCGDTGKSVAVDATGCATGVAINLQGVNFLYDSHELTPEAQHILDRVADILSQQPDLRLEVAGHTDSQGDPAYNQWLSLKRAEAVRDYIVAQGVNPNHIGAGGYGGQRPIADNSTREGLRTNRRVELRRLH